MLRLFVPRLSEMISTKFLKFPLAIYQQKSDVFQKESQNIKRKSKGNHTTLPAFICSKLAIKTLEQGANGVILLPLLLTLNIFCILF